MSGARHLMSGAGACHMISGAYPMISGAHHMISGTRQVINLAFVVPTAPTGPPLNIEATPMVNVISISWEVSKMDPFHQGSTQ